MKPNKIKRYRMPVSRTFPVKHPRAGERTMFVCKILHALNLPVASETMHFRCGNDCNSTCGRMLLTPKLHIIRANYNLWAERMAEVQTGLAVIELFYWSGSPYNYQRDGSKQIVFATLDKNSGCGVQQLYLCDNSVEVKCDYCEGRGSVMVPKLYPSGHAEVDEECDYCEGTGYVNNKVNDETLAKNDGLSLDDFKAWFKGYDLSKPMAILQFTGFRY